MQNVRCEQELSHCCQLPVAIDKNMKVAEGDPELQCWFLQRPFTSMYIISGGICRKRASELKVRHRTALRNLIFVEWHNLEMFAVIPKHGYQHYVIVLAFWHNLKSYHLLSVP